MADRENPRPRANKKTEKPAQESSREKSTAKGGRTTASVRKKAATEREKPARSMVAIRMYRGILGDFFFIRHSLDDKKVKPFKMLIDCGVLQRIGSEEKKPTTALGKERIIAGVKNLIGEFGSDFDVVVVTHEHYDHLSGFIHARDIFDSLELRNLWVAWTEDRSDALANAYRDKKNRAVAALTALVDSPALKDTEKMNTVRDLMQFYGPPGNVGSGVGMVADNGALSGNASCEAVIDWLKQRAGATNTSYLKPGEVHKWGVGNTLRAYVLGPPRDDDRLRKLDPSGEGKREVYLAKGEDVAAVSSLAAVHADLEGASAGSDQPFSLPYRREYFPGKFAAGNSDDILSSDPIVKKYEQIPASERIDEEWLGSAESLALKIDGDVNNTSLVLALELPDREILLFAADAQVGNWLSWRDQDYPADDVVNTETLSIDRLLSRTILYKVGHHASHNATLREGGLELMTDPRLCAMIPLVQKVASEQKTKSAPKGWQMPYENLDKRLKERTRGRIVRGDGDVNEETTAFKGSVFNVSYGPDTKTKDPLWVELTYEQKNNAI